MGFKKMLAKTENTPSEAVLYHENRLCLNKKPYKRRLCENNLEEILFSHDILLSLQQTKWFFEMAK